MARLVFAPSAIVDARDILTALSEKAGRPVAAAYFDRFQSTFNRIAVVRPYVVICRAASDTIEIVRVIHGRRKITRRAIALR